MNRLVGGAGDDHFKGGSGTDLYDGGKGVDMVDYAGSMGVTVNLGAGRGWGGFAEGDSYAGVENVIGSSLADTLTGDGAANALTGGQGKDVLTGGAGADRFVYTAVGDSGPGEGQCDCITDFSQAEGDRIDLSGIDADRNSAGDQTFIGPDGFSGQVGQLRYDWWSGHTVIQGAKVST
ncbi:M10 family metallopeptidase C-terminal domain-containing protein [Inquilinus limosus]|uniref:M10 family metallopeptidase C-terminal domain-containing protein n=1 Tax=Inquilinus limosus TaxID=171674 RepID=UPI003F18E8C4